MQETNIQIENERKLRVLCNLVEFEKMSADTIQAMEKFPLDFPLTVDFILGTQTSLAAAMILTGERDLQSLATAFLYRWWKANKENNSEFTETEI